MRNGIAVRLLVVSSFAIGCGDSSLAPHEALLATFPSPGGVPDLRVTGATRSTLTVTWTQVDDATGSPASYRVKHAQPPIDWKTATIGCDRTVEGTEIGAEISCVIEGLTPGTHEVQLMSFRLVDGVWNDARYSNIASGSTEASVPDPTVTDLTVSAVSATSLTLTWTEVNGGEGSPAWYRVKYASPPLTWSTATIGCNRTIHGTQIGATASCTIEGLAPASAYEIQLMSYRLESGVWVDAHHSNVAAASTASAEHPAVWETLPSLPIPVRSPSATVVDGRIYVIGGSLPDHEKTGAVQVFDPHTLRWSQQGSAPFEVDFHTAVELGGLIHLISGMHADVGHSDEHWTYDPSTEEWEMRAPIPTEVNAATTQVVDGRIYVFGGVVFQDYRNAVQVYDPASDSWSSGGVLPTASMSVVSAVVDGQMHLMGGQTPLYETSNQHLVYDPVSQSFEAKDPIPYAQEAGGGGAVGDALCVFGGRIARQGRHNTPFSASYCLQGDRWFSVPAMSVARAEIAYVTLGDAIYAIGGDGAAGAVGAVARLWPEGR